MLSKVEYGGYACYIDGMCNYLRPSWLADYGSSVENGEQIRDTLYGHTKGKAESN
jgi:hypothetical protein